VAVGLAVEVARLLEEELEVLAVQALSSSNTYNPQPMLCLTLLLLRFGNAQQVLTPLTTW
jgi:hypothetical protein